MSEPTAGQKGNMSHIGWRERGGQVRRGRHRYNKSRKLRRTLRNREEVFQNKTGSDNKTNLDEYGNKGENLRDR